MSNYAAQLNADGYVVQVIVGTPEWATANLGGTWVAAEKYDVAQEFPGIGYGYDPTHPRKFAPVAPPGLEKALDGKDAIPPGTFFYDDTAGNIADVEVIARRRGVLTAAEAAAKAPVKPTKD